MVLPGSFSNTCLRVIMGTTLFGGIGGKSTKRTAKNTRLELALSRAEPVPKLAQETRIQELEKYNLRGVPRHIRPAFLNCRISGSRARKGLWLLSPCSRQITF